MSRKDAKLPVGADEKITIICTEEQEKYIKDFGCIACDDDVCDCAFCGEICAYHPDSINFKRKDNKLEEILTEVVNETNARMDELDEQRKKKEITAKEYNYELTDIVAKLEILNEICAKMGL